MHTDTIDPVFVFNQKGERKINNELGLTQNELTLPEFVPVRFSSLLISSYQNTDGTKKDIQSKSIPVKKISSPEDISVLDPAKGSGHILVYAFEVLYEIYRSQGYLESEIAPLILNKNLYGLDIDDRAAQLAGFALMMKARMYDKELFNKKIALNLCAIQETREECALNRGKYPELCRLWDFFIDAKNYGSILKVEGFDFERLRGEVDLLKKEGTLDFVSVGSKLEALVKQASLMSRKYDCVITNPPYMGSGGMNAKLKQFVNIEYPDSKNDLMTCFMEKGFEFLSDDGFLAMINIPSWMFLSSFQTLREKILKNHTIYSLLHNGRGIFGADFGTVAFVINERINHNFNGVYRRLFTKKSAVDSIKQKETWFKDSKFGLFSSNHDDFLKIPGTSIAYWATGNFKNVFARGINLNSISTVFEGLKTRDNDRFLRLWQEIEYSDIFDKWFYYSKGGGFRKWFGNNEYVINWENEGFEVKSFKKSSGTNFKFYLTDAVTYSALTIAKFSSRFITKSFFGGGGSGILNLNDKINYVLAFTNTKLSSAVLSIFSESLNFEVGNVGCLPIILPESEQTKSHIDHLTQQNIDISKEEWDSRETSWDLTTNELLRHKTSPHLEDALNTYCTYWKDQFFKLHANEEELNRIFIDIYDLADEITPDVPLDDITILREESEIKDGGLLKSFFKDHVRTYQKKPIYWLFTSGKGRGFDALVYMHRYDKTLLAKMRTDYLLELEAKLDARIGMLSDSARDKQEKERIGKLMQELAAYDEKLNNKALEFIEIDLDDGVAVNYARFGGLVEGI